MVTRASIDASERKAPAEDFTKRPEEECDLVMEGGITSGVVYPPAILKLAQRYRFRAVGGASAGAIAAAATAAAEYGREQGGFIAFKEMQQELAKAGFFEQVFRPSEETRPLFEAARTVKGIIDRWNTTEPKESGFQLAASLIKAAEGKVHGLPLAGPDRDGALGALQSLLRAVEQASKRAERGGEERDAERALWYVVALAVAVFLPFILIALWSGNSAALGFSLVVSAFWLIVIAVFGGRAFSLYQGALVLLREAGRIKRGIAAINSPEGSFGFCAGHDPEKSGADGPLTDWMHAQFQKLAGRRTGDAPLTCQELADKQVTFQLVTTDLTKGQPMIMPWKDDSFFFKKVDFEKLFSDDVMAALLRYSDARAREHTAYTLPAGVHHFPAGKDLPIIVATRMSLSFPVLLCAVPLYALVESGREAQRQATAAEPVALAPEHFTVHWFSDGGIANNFPIHFFDSWIPSRPTFGITLADSPFEGPSLKPTEPPAIDASRTHVVHADTHEDDERIRKSVVMLRPKQGDTFAASPPSILPSYTIKGLPSFVNALLATTRGYRDKLQASLPSYLERVVTVFLSPNEGGLNLDMSPEIVQGIFKKGERAGALIHEFNYDEHRWVRSLVLASRLEAELNRVRYPASPGAPKDIATLRADYAEVLAAMNGSLDPPAGAFYRAVDSSEDAAAKGAPEAEGVRRIPGWQTQASARMAALFDLMDEWDRLELAWRARHQPMRDEVDAYTFFRANKPIPEALLRVTPEL
jgi:predicted acylesterase/phospholipase RssA